MSVLGRSDLDWALDLGIVDLGQSVGEAVALLLEGGSLEIEEVGEVLGVVGLTTEDDTVEAHVVRVLEKVADVVLASGELGTSGLGVEEWLR